MFGQRPLSGPVEDDEILIRTLYSPVQINKETGVVNPVNIRQDALKRGLSVNRKRHTREAELEARIEKKIADDMKTGKQTDGYYKVVTARCSDIRTLIGEDERRQFYVYDTALEGDKSHADVCQAVDPPPKTVNRKSIRDAIGSRLYELFAAPATDLAAVFAEG